MNKTTELAGDSRCNTDIRNVFCLRKVIRGRNKGGYPRGQQVTQRHRTDKGHFISKNNAPQNVNLLLPTLLRHPFDIHSSSRALSLFLICPLRFPRSLFFIPSIRVIRIESFNKKFCSPAESAPFCEFKWKSGRESGRGWRPGGRRALLACKLKCCHLNANKTPPRAESSVEKEGGGRKRG